jgi:hypothetical protein
MTSQTATKRQRKARNDVLCKQTAPATPVGGHCRTATAAEVHWRLHRIELAQLFQEFAGMP